MNLIDKNMKMAEVIHENYLVLPVISRFGMRLGFGNKKVDRICEDKAVDADFFVAVVNSFIDIDKTTISRLQGYPVIWLVDYLRNTHQDYLNRCLPELESMMERMGQECQRSKNEVMLLQRFFNDYRLEVERHLKREEEVVFPYVEKVSRAMNEKVVTEKLYQVMATYSISDYSGEHDNIEEKLYDLKNLIIKYLPPVMQPALCNSILMKLFELEKDLNEHSRLENEVLVPVVKQYEGVLKQLFDNKRGQ